MAAIKHVYRSRRLVDIFRRPGCTTFFNSITPSTPPFGILEKLGNFATTFVAADDVRCRRLHVPRIARGKRLDSNKPSR